MNGQQFSAVLPNQQQSPAETLAQISQQLYARRQQQAAQLKEQQDRADRLMRDAYSELNMDHFGTGTILDPTISHNLTEAKQNIARQLIQNPNTSSAELMYDIGNAVNSISAYSTKAKLVRTQAEAAVKEYAKNPSVDSAKLLENGLKKAFFNYDPASHEFRLKAPQEINETADYITPELGYSLKPGTYEAFYDRVNKAPQTPYKSKIVNDRNGVRTWAAYEGKFSPIFHDLTDSKGNVVNGASVPASSLKVKTQPIKLGDKVFQGVTDEAYNYFASDPVTNAILERDARELVGDNPSVNLEAVKRIVLHDNLSNYTRGYINKTDEGIDNSQQQAHQWQLIAKALKDKPSEASQWNNLYDTVYDQMVPGTTTTITHLPDQFNRIVMQTVKDIPTTDEGPVVQDRVTLHKDLKGNMSILVDGKPITQVSKIGVNSKVNHGQKPMQQVYQNASQPTPPPVQQQMPAPKPQASSKTISKEAFRKMSIADRQSFINNGGKIN